MSILYSIIIPTLPGSVYLSYSIKSVLSLGRDDVEIIVTIDGSLDCQEYANQVAKQINYASSVRFIFTGCIGNMISNFEHGISHATGQYIHVLGHDDCILSDAFDRHRLIINAYPGKIVSWFRLPYYWPSSYVDSNILVLRKDPTVTHIPRRKALNTLMTLFSDFMNYPSVYNSFIPRDLILKILNYNKDVFGKSVIWNYSYLSIVNPDVSSALLCTIFAEDGFMHLGEPLSLSGISSSSNGMSWCEPGNTQTASFLSSYGFTSFADIVDDLLVPSTNSKTMAIASEHIRILRNYFSATWIPDSEWISTLINAYLVEELDLNPTVLPQYIQLASKYGLPSYVSFLSSLSSDPASYPSSQPTSASKSIVRLDDKACMIDSRDFGIYDSFLASKHYRRLAYNQHKL